MRTYLTEQQLKSLQDLRDHSSVTGTLGTDCRAIKCGGGATLATAWSNNDATYIASLVNNANTLLFMAQETLRLGGEVLRLRHDKIQLAQDHDHVMNVERASHSRTKEALRQAEQSFYDLSEQHNDLVDRNLVLQEELHKVEQDRGEALRILENDNKRLKEERARVVDIRDADLDARVLAEKRNSDLARTLEEARIQRDKAQSDLAELTRCKNAEERDFVSRLDSQRAALDRCHEKITFLEARDEEKEMRELRKTISTQREELARIHEKMSYEVAKANDDRTRLNNEVTRLKHNLDGMTRRSDALSNSLADTAAEHNGLVTDLAKAKAEQKNLFEQWDAGQTRCYQLEQELAVLKRPALADQCSRLEKELSAVRSSLLKEQNARVARNRELDKIGRQMHASAANLYACASELVKAVPGNKEEGSDG